MVRLLLSVLALAAAGYASQAHASRSYDNCTGFIDSLPATISRQGTWCLRKDLYFSPSQGVALTVLPADPRHPDGCFVEDTALLTARGAILTRPGAPSRRGEADAIEAALKPSFPDLVRIDAPGTVDAGDVCEADGHFLIGLSARTNDAGAAQLAGLLGDLGYRSDLIDIRAMAAMTLGSASKRDEPKQVGTIDDLPVFSSNAFAAPSSGVLLPTAMPERNN
jgi:hypothetical protein